jgi:hypothetical protein
MNDICIGCLGMLVLGAMPALSSAVPRAGDDILIVPAPWSGREAAVRASMTMAGSIMRVSDKTGIVIVRPDPTSARDVKTNLDGVFLLRGRAPSCGAPTSPKTTSNPL